jgi:hypothetical protein
MLKGHPYGLFPALRAGALPIRRFFSLLGFGTAASLKIPPVISTNAQSKLQVGPLSSASIKFFYCQQDTSCLHQVVAGIVEPVYFAVIKARTPEDSKENKIRRLFDEAGFFKAIRKGDLDAISIARS